MVPLCLTAAVYHLMGKEGTQIRKKVRSQVWQTANVSDSTVQY